MDFKQMDDKVWLYGQIAPGDVEYIASRGFKGIICNRPDGEADDQPDFDDIEEIAQTFDIPMAYIPYLNGLLTPKLLQKFKDAIDVIDGPVLLYCRSGRRSTILWDAVRGPNKIIAE